MPFEIKTPTRANRPLRIGLYGLGGSGKSMSSLLLARGLVGDGIVLIDTESSKAGYYSDIPGWKMIDLDDYNPERMLEALEAAVGSGARCVIVDSISACWQGKGGCIDIANSQINKYGKALQGLAKWDLPKALHRDMMNYMLVCPAHVIFTCRVKRNFRQVRDEKTGQDAIVQDGFEPISEWNTAYETDINLDLDMNHRATVTKDVCRVLPKQPFVIGEQHGKMLADWLGGGGERHVEVPEGAAFTDPYLLNALALMNVPPDKRVAAISKKLGQSNPDDPMVIERLRAWADGEVNQRAAK